MEKLEVTKVVFCPEQQMIVEGPPETDRKKQENNIIAAGA